MKLETFDLAANRLVAWVKIPLLDVNTFLRILNQH